MRRHHWLAAMAENAYSEHVVEDKGIEILITRYEGYQVLIFRGTDSVLDMIRNARAFPKYSRRCGWVHSGFLSGARAVFDDYVDVLNSHRPFIVAGHSLGGAVALLTTLLLKSVGINVTECVTFGAPRTFYYPAKKRFGDTKVYQYKHGDDFVTGLGLGFHVEPLINIGKASGNRLADHGISNYEQTIA